MVKTVSAIYDNGVLIPEKTLEIENQQKVHLIIISATEPMRFIEESEDSGLKVAEKLYSARKKNILRTLEPMVKSNLFDLHVPKSNFMEFFNRKTSLDRVKASLGEIPGEYVDRILDQERNDF